jgi:hypothetical protein
MKDPYSMEIISTTSLYRLVVTLLLVFLGSIKANDNDHDMTYVGLAESITSPGGFCLDGSMAGYYIRTGSNPSLFVIHLRGGGGCQTEEECLARNGTSKGSSLLWKKSILGDRLLDGNCATNPDFCDATAVHVPYCTGDAHLGNNTEASEETWGLYFDGHANFAAIVKNLITEYGLGDADNVLLTGGSAGSVGAYFNVDWLADRLGPEIDVRGAPNAGWYTPGSLPNDLPDIFAPSDYERFVAGDKGNPFYDQFLLLNGAILPDRIKVKDLLSSDCLANFAPNKWWACASLHVAYRYIKSPLFNVHSQYDSNQIFSTKGLAPKNPDESEIDSVKSYIEMWGEATRASMEQILNDDTVTSKDHPDGIFSTSCLSHGTWGTMIDGQLWLPIVRDWFFDLGEKTQYYRLMETCSVEEGGLELPCNPAQHCRFEPKPKLPPHLKKCAKTMMKLKCVESYGNKKECLKCVKRNRKKFSKSGCNKKLVKTICKFAESNEIGKK